MCRERKAKRVVACGIAIVAIACSLPLRRAHGEEGNGARAHLFSINTEIRSCTGFRVKGVKGIITSLHGVAGAKEIRIRPAAGNIQLKEPVKIIRVNIECDLAIVSSDEVLQLPAGGLELGDRIKGWRSRNTVSVIGFPQSITTALRNELQIADPASDELIKLLPAKIGAKLALRRSPGPALHVLCLLGFLSPGHSGAPVLDSEDRVIAVGDGGLRTDGINWAVPISLSKNSLTSDESGWKDVDRVSEEVAKLGGAVNGLFEDEGATTSPDHIVLEVGAAQMDTVVIITCNGKKCGDDEVSTRSANGRTIFRISPKPNSTYSVEAWLGDPKLATVKYQPVKQEVKATRGQLEVIEIKLEMRAASETVAQFRQEIREYHELMQKFYGVKGVLTVADGLDNLPPPKPRPRRGR